MNALEKAEQLKQELDSLRPLNAEAEARIMQKFRLDWNYHSNNLEGNSLTYGETKALILFGITAQGKPLKDHFEITGHNEAINWILEIIKDETPLNEKFIRELHTLLLKESSYKEAQTAEGKPTRRKIEVGKYKTQPNHVVTVTGETFYFATPEETPAKMYELIEWFRNEKEKQGVNPIILAALFHYRFIRIHPFDDGNGRTARILMNFILMQFGYPPVIIKTEDKENYFAVLRLADADELEPFVEYIAKNLVHSLEIMIRGAKGENIEEPDDLDKELALLERKIRSIGKKIDVPKSNEVLLEVFDKSIQPLIEEFIKTCGKFDKFYVETHFFIYSNAMVTNKGKKDAIANIRKKIQEQALKISEVNLRYTYTAINQMELGNNNYQSEIFIKFDRTHYRVSSGPEFETLKNENSKIYEKLYTEQMSSEEIKTLVKIKADSHKTYLEGLFNDYQNKLSLQEHFKN